MKLKVVLFAFVLLLTFTNTFAQQSHKTKNLVLILIDGYRWQELFRGADSTLLSICNEITCTFT